MNLYGKKICFKSKKSDFLIFIFKNHDLYQPWYARLKNSSQCAGASKKYTNFYSQRHGSNTKKSHNTSINTNKTKAANKSFVSE